MKRVKLINDVPPVQNGVVSASSKTPVIDLGRIVDIHTAMSDDMGLFFDNVKENKDIPNALFPNP